MNPTLELQIGATCNVAPTSCCSEELPADLSLSTRCRKMQKQPSRSLLHYPCLQETLKENLLRKITSFFELSIMAMFMLLRTSPLPTTTSKEIAFSTPLMEPFVRFFQEPPMIGWGLFLIVLGNRMWSNTPHSITLPRSRHLDFLALSASRRPPCRQLQIAAWSSLSSLTQLNWKAASSPPPACWPPAISTRSLEETTESRNTTWLPSLTLNQWESVLATWLKCVNSLWDVPPDPHFRHFDLSIMSVLLTPALLCFNHCSERKMTQSATLLRRRRLKMLHPTILMLIALMQLTILLGPMPYMIMMLLTVVRGTMTPMRSSSGMLRHLMMLTSLLAAPRRKRRKVSSIGHLKVQRNSQDQEVGILQLVATLRLGAWDFQSHLAKYASDPWRDLKALSLVSALDAMSPSAIGAHSTCAPFLSIWNMLSVANALRVTRANPPQVQFHPRLRSKRCCMR